MEINYAYKFKGLSSKELWDVIQDPDVLKEVLPGCKKFEKVGDEQYEAIMGINMGPIKGEFTADVEQVDKNEPESYRLLVKAKGKPGEINADAKMTFIGDDEGTELTCVAAIEVTGLMATIGQRMVGGVAKTILKRFMKDIEKEAKNA